MCFKEKPELEDERRAKILVVVGRLLDKLRWNLPLAEETLSLLPFLFDSFTFVGVYRMLTLIE